MIADMSHAVDRSASAVGNDHGDRELKSAAVFDVMGGFRDLLDRRDVAPHGKDNNLEWNTDIRQAMKSAREQGLPLVMHFTLAREGSCDWCTAFDKQLADPSLKSLQDKAVFLRIPVDPGKVTDGSRLAEIMKIEGYPTISVVNIDNAGVNELRRMSGYQTSSNLKAKLEDTFRPGSEAMTLV
ncbi:MAG: hypothetical protein HY986_07220 [Candidatus Melainabacteria bacterium]|nr:hypothetical protein [Candidatus Melainabacteria bacterium]